VGLLISRSSLIGSLGVVNLLGNFFEVRVAIWLQGPIKAGLIANMALAGSDGDLEDQTILVAIDEDLPNGLEMAGLLAFEPEPGNYQMLKKNMELNHIKNMSIFEMAVCGSSRDQDFCIYEDGSTGSHSLYKKDGAFVKRKKVQTISIDDIIEKEHLGRIDFLKLDCEGAEHSILGNMTGETAAKIMHIAMETHGVQPESAIDIPGRLEELGFEVRMEQNGGYVYARRIERYYS
jgi:FkbM family methyltransferase